jgi:sulfur transfer protein SufE
MTICRISGVIQNSRIVKNDARFAPIFASGTVRLFPLRRQLDNMHRLPGCQSALFLLSHPQPPGQRDSRVLPEAGLQMFYFYDGIRLRRRD